MKSRISAALFLGLACLVLSSCGEKEQYNPNVKDEAAWIRDNEGEDKVPQDEEGTLYPTHKHDAFKGMDSHIKDVYGYEFSEDQIEGRNTWVMWSGGNQAFWDYLARNSNGIVDFLKICDSRYVRRDERFGVMGIVPNPGMDETDPKADLGEPTKDNYYGLHLDSYSEGGGAYVEGPAPDPKIYGYSSGIVGLRLFPRETDPDPRVRAEWEKAKDDWDPDRYINDEQYYKDPELIRPYRVGMSCGFCHVSANPMNPPEDMADAKWDNLSSNIGSQYFWFGRIFGQDFKRDNLLYYITNYPEPGSLDTSLVATDGNNNPNTMNGVFQLLPRVVVALRSGKEITPKDTLKNMPRLDEPFDIDGDGKLDGANDVKAVEFSAHEQSFMKYLGLDSPTLPALGDETSRHTPKVLAGGADSIGARGALCRVYLNIGEFSEEWRQLQNIMIGIVPQKPFLMERASKDSINWNVTMRRSTNVAKYFLANSVTMRLQDAPGGAKHVKPNNDPQVVQGAKVFARNCFVCHSSEGQPDGFWDEPNNWKKWIASDNYVENAEKLMVDLLEQPVTGDKPEDDPFFDGFVKKNYLSTDARYHVSDIGTNTARSIADNAGTSERMWASYSSKEFKDQKKEATIIKIADPYKKETRDWPLNTEAGPGRYRPHSLSSMWAHGPYLHNNSVGYYPYDWGPDPRPSTKGEDLSTFVDGIQSVDSRVKIYEDGTRRLLGLESEPDENAKKYRGFSKAPRRGYDSIQRLEKDASIVLPSVVVPDLIYMQTMAVLGFGIPRWVLITLLLGIFVTGIFLFKKGVQRIKAAREAAEEGKQPGGSMFRNVALVLFGLTLALGVFILKQKDTYSIGYIPKGTPLNLVANINGPGWILDSPERKELAFQALIGLKKAELRKVKSLEEVEVSGRPLVDILLELSKCPDMILDKGHDFGKYDTVALAKGKQVEVSEEDREALIEFLKKF